MTADTSHGIARSYGFRVAIERCRDGFSCARCLGGYQLEVRGYGSGDKTHYPLPITHYLLPITYYLTEIGTYKIFTLKVKDTSLLT